MLTKMTEALLLHQKISAANIQLATILPAKVGRFSKDSAVLEQNSFDALNGFSVV